jgi:hypothetical protein
MLLLIRALSLANYPDFGRTHLINGVVMLSDAKHSATSTDYGWWFACETDQNLSRCLTTKLFEVAGFLASLRMTSDAYGHLARIASQLHARFVLRFAGGR